MGPNSPLLKRLLSAAIGLFALWQMVFLIAANVIDFVPRDEPEPPGVVLDVLQDRGRFTNIHALQKAVDGFGDVLDAYSEFTGQEQVWPLFAPGFPSWSTFTSIEVQFENGNHVEILSDFEPRDYNHAPFRVPFFNTRRYNVEYQFIPTIMQHSEESIRDAELGPFVREQTLSYFRHSQPTLMRWLSWRVKEYLKDHPEPSPIVAIIYKARYIPGPLPADSPKVWDKPVRVRPIARWRNPDQPPPAGELPLQVYDAAAERWVTLLKDGGER